MYLIITWFLLWFASPTVETFTADGTWVKPNGVTKVTVECWGAGGGGGGASNNNQGGGGGAGGQYAIKVVTYNAARQSITYVVGTGGPGGSGASSGTVGEDTDWQSGVVVAKGGAFGVANNGAGGVGSTTGGVGDTVYEGGDGAAGAVNSGAGGGGAGSGGAGGDAVGVGAGGGTTQNGGNGGAGLSSSSDGNPGNNYGGGGSGGKRTTVTSRTGGAGAQGYIRITYSRRLLSIN